MNIDYFFIIAYLLFILFVPIIIIGGIIFLIFRFLPKNKSKALSNSVPKKWYLQLAFCKEDAVSQILLLFSILFLGITLSAINKNFGSIIEIKTLNLIVAIVAIISAYTFKSIYALVFGLIDLFIWYLIQTFAWYDEMKGGDTFLIFIGINLFFILFFILSLLHQTNLKWKRFSMIYFILSLLEITFSLFMLSGKSALHLIQDLAKENFFTNPAPVLISLVILTISILIVLFLVQIKTNASLYEKIVPLILTLIFIGIPFIPYQNIFLESRYYAPPLGFTGILLAIFFNLLVFLFLIRLIFLGYLKRETWLINLGALLLFFLIIFKYFDWFFTFLDKSIFFILAGILMVAVGWSMEKARRQLVNNLTSEQPLN